MAVGETSRLKQLIAVAEEDSSDKRRDLLREITDVFMAAPDRYTRQLRCNTSTSSCRRSPKASKFRYAAKLPKNSPMSPEAPRGLVRQLAHDEISVAEPILKRSQLLSLKKISIRVVRQRGPGHMKAITERKEVPEKVSSELVERGDKEVLVSLAKNSGAKLNNDSWKNWLSIRAPSANSRRRWRTVTICRRNF